MHKHSKHFQNLLAEVWKLLAGWSLKHLPKALSGRRGSRVHEKGLDPPKDFRFHLRLQKKGVESQAEGIREHLLSFLPP